MIDSDARLLLDAVAFGPSYCDPMTVMKNTIIGAAWIFLFSFAICAPQALAAPAHNSCASLMAMKLPNTTITSAQEVTGGVLTPSGSRQLTGLPAFCRVVAVTRPAINFEVWLPLETTKGKSPGAGQP